VEVAELPAARLLLPVAAAPLVEVKKSELIQADWQSP